jgi:YopX protein
MMKDLKLRIRLKHKVDGQLITLYNDVFDSKNGIAFYPIEQDKWHILSVDLFTGLHDLNGKEIYEGDIIKKDNGVWGVIVWKAPSFEVTVSETQSSLYTKEWIEDSIVIGNVYENPELLNQ